METHGGELSRDGGGIARALIGEPAEHRPRHDRLARGERPVELLPAGVLDYIERNRLYRGARDPI